MTTNYATVKSPLLIIIDLIQWVYPKIENSVQGRPKYEVPLCKRFIDQSIQN